MYVVVIDDVISLIRSKPQLFIHTHTHARVTADTCVHMCVYILLAPTFFFSSFYHQHPKFRWFYFNHLFNILFISPFHSYFLNSFHFPRVFAVVIALLLFGRRSFLLIQHFQLSWLLDKCCDNLACIRCTSVVKSSCAQSGISISGLTLVSSLTSRESTYNFCDGHWTIRDVYRTDDSKTSLRTTYIWYL